MRLSLGSVGALTAALLIAFAFWPDTRAVRGPERIVAQEKPKAPHSEPTKRRPTAAPGPVGKAPETISDMDEIAKLKRERERLEARVSKLEKIREGLRSRVDNPGKDIASLPLADIRQMRTHGAFAPLGNPREPEGAKRPGERPQTPKELRPPTPVPTPAPTRVPSSPKQRGSGL